MPITGFLMCSWFCCVPTSVLLPGTSKPVCWGDQRLRISEHRKKVPLPGLLVLTQGAQWNHLERFTKKGVLNIQHSNLYQPMSKSLSCYSFVLGFPLGPRCWLKDWSSRRHASSQSSSTRPGNLFSMTQVCYKNFSSLLLGCPGVCTTAKETVNKNEINCVCPYLREALPHTSLSCFRNRSSVFKEEPLHPTEPELSLAALSRE